MGFASIYRKIRQIFDDPTLRKWLCYRVIFRTRAVPFSRSTPPYLNISDCAEVISGFVKYRDLPKGELSERLTIDLAGSDCFIQKNKIREFFRTFSGDTESCLSLHRFSWLTQLSHEEMLSWFSSIWQIWLSDYGREFSGWAWHPYTVAERLMNVLNYSEIFGLPGPRNATIDSLCQHGEFILQNLEYFGERNTGNHLVNNGRGLFIAGCLLEYNRWADAGALILINEAKRLFLASGAIREGSTHYQLLITKWYLECYLISLRFSRGEAKSLRLITEKAISCCQSMALKGGFPLIGDVSPDCHPDYLECLWGNPNKGLIEKLNRNDALNFRKLLQSISHNMRLDGEESGWLRKEFGEWSALWATPKGGWPPYPGHAHQDFGSCEVHYGSAALFRDLGRRSYDPIGAEDVLGSAHNTIRINGEDPYPPNKPYYSDEFRSSVTGTNPIWTSTDDSVEVLCNAFKRLRKVGTWRRKWHFTENKIIISDDIEGCGMHNIERRLQTTLPVKNQGSYTLVGDFKVSCVTSPIIGDSKRWLAYGRGENATTLIYKDYVRLPWHSEISAEFSPEE